MGICVNLLHRHPKELRGILDMGDIWDLVALRSERRDLMATPPQPWKSDDGHEPMIGRIWPMSPEVAEVFFLQRFGELTRGGSPKRFWPPSVPSL